MACQRQNTLLTKVSDSVTTLQQEEFHAVQGKLSEKYLHYQDPIVLASALDAVPDNTLHATTYLLCWKNPLTQGTEITFRVQGYLVDLELPPIAKNTRLPRNVAWAKQRVHICGLGSSAFQESVRNIKAIHEVMAHRLSVNNVREWQPVQFEGHLDIDIQCSYFPRCHNNDTILPSFPDYMDPFGILMQAGQNKGLRPSQGSVVEYYERTVQNFGAKTVVKHRQADPGVFRRGYLVEAALTFELNRTKKGIWVFFLTLRALEILDRLVDEAYLFAKLDGTESHQSHVRVSLKRAREYQEEGIESADQDLKRLFLTEDHHQGKKISEEGDDAVMGTE
ncbi:hypothetical protein K439DRAFT_1562903 [Ramaria rubella]|nr:hypothetical protein K439DRAFT_1562903 [Ramaria rubella]